MAQHKLFGTKAEIYARDFLLNKGYLLLAQNYRYGRSEVDLLMQKKETLICVEVKARSTDFFGSPEKFISSKKIQLLVGAVNNYMEQNNIDLEVRFDVIAITVKQDKWHLKHIKNAFNCWE